MKVKSIDLSWFRGAGFQAVLNTDLKNVVVYGANGSGKSSFSDAIEYIVAGGKIRHLMHEYSGTRQEKGIINTHAPAGCCASIRITFEGDISIDASIALDGTPSFSSSTENMVDLIQTWELERLILRQDEVAAFVELTKGGKYSVLLPLLGLEHLEQAAENVSKLCRSIEEEGQLLSKKMRLRMLKEETSKCFPDLSEDSVINVLKDIAKGYIKDEIPTELQPLTDALIKTIKKSIDSLTPEITRHALVIKIFEEDLSKKLVAMSKMDEEIIGKVDALLDIHIEILKAASKYSDKVGSGKKEIECPACGRIIGTGEFSDHVRHELQSLKDICTIRDSAIEVRRVLKNSIKQVLSYAADGNISAWLEQKSQKELKEALTELAVIDKKKWDDTYSAEDKAKLQEIVPVIVSRIKKAVDLLPPSNQKLINDSTVVEASKNIPLISALTKQVTAITSIIEALKVSESQFRDSIRLRTMEIIEEVSNDIQTLWSKIHPGEPIEDVKLYLPEDAEKSIEIGLRFHGQEQLSPRLTLSEGHRNSLGLCIFLALARLAGNSQRPIFMDDIVTSLDRWHRGNVTRLLSEELTDRQILLFTHDREWFQELRVLLPNDNWKFLGLKPWNSPSIGLQWSVSEDTFDEARSLIAQDCEAAGNCVRRIMDTHLAITAEKLKIRMPYARGDHNDHRGCVEFLKSILGEAEDRLRKEEKGSWKKYQVPISDWEKARDLLVSWANRASHTGSLVPSEVENLIQACEVALNRFKCTDCGTNIWRADQAGKEIMQCRCGKIQWRYD